VKDITQLLQSAQQGDAQSARDLLPLVYEELRRIAAVRMSRESPGQTLQATALVHEAWLRLSGHDNAQFEGRAHFFAAAAEAMRRILIETARRKRAQKRGGEAVREELKDDLLIESAPAEELIAIDEALQELSMEDPQCADLVKLRYFVGMTMEQAAEALGLSLRSAHRLWTYAKAALRQKIGSEVR
jgi:RNA polymerase sigma factor (TIGR02999 family)